MTYNFVKVHTAKDLLISIIILGFGAGLFFIHKGLGIMLVISGILALVFFKSGYRDPVTQVILHKTCAETDKKCRQSLLDFISGLIDEPEIVRTGVGAVVRIEMYHNLEEGVAYIQLFDFENYNYVPATEILSLDENRAAKLLYKLSSVTRNCR